MPRKKLEPKGILAERVNAAGRRQIALTDPERRAFARSELVERAVLMYLDLETDRNQREIAQELGITLEELKTLTRSDEFQEAYSAHFLELGHDPRLVATQHAIMDLLPAAMRELRKLIAGGVQVPATVKLKAIEDVMKLSGIEAPTPAKNDKKELAEFLRNAGINIENVNITNQLPPEYQDALAFSRDVVEGEVQESASGQETSLAA